MQYSNQGPCGANIDDFITAASNANAAFSQQGWEEAKQQGCLPCTGQRLPVWPPPNNQFVYPTLEKADPLIRGTCPNMQWGSSCKTTDGNFYPSGYASPASAERLLEFNSYPDAPTTSFLKNYPSAYPPQSFPPTLYAAPADGDNIKKLYPVHLNPECEGEFEFKTLFPCMWNTLVGITYDLQNWNELPVDGFTEKLRFIFVRDSRVIYLLFVFVFVLIVALVFQALFYNKGSNKK